MSYKFNITDNRGVNVFLGIGSALIFGISVTNSIVYTQGTTSSQNNKCGTTSGNGNTGVNSNCSTLMLILNIIIAIIAFIAMIYFFYKAAYGDTATISNYVNKATAPITDWSNQQFVQGQGFVAPTYTTIPAPLTSTSSLADIGSVYGTPNITLGAPLPTTTFVAAPQ